MPKYFSSDLLRTIRNEIPIDWVVTGLLKMEAKNTCGLLRFRCPLCFSFHTATKDETNLARCFDCKNNFNPIELVMAVDGKSFVEAVEFLMENTPIK